ncbi:CAZyme family GH72 [Penicillium robsamsonii]|uniref:CAZyme family GH72 n=1 Tax=Penicillium robsamsonii TaxID=1792511 RepID=UPI002547A234|nr:CAZyme family GH72 [Penicillium robsamsonii]KAJ5837074.1 CAZyme family GH72 [Penicillium robsamsonii]
MLLPVHSVAGNGFLSGDHPSRIKDGAYTGNASGSTAIDTFADGTRTSTSIRPRSSNSTQPHTYSKATMAGISVGCTLGMILLFVSLFLYFRRRYRRNRRARPSCALPQTETATGSSSQDAPLDELAHTDSPSQRSGSDPKAQGLDSVVVVHRGKEDV